MSIFQKILILLLSLFLFNTASFAACECVCIDGKKEPICESALDIPPPCIGICAIATPRVPPIQTPSIPPIGTTKCVQKQVQNPYTGKYEWRTVCN